MNLGSKIVTVAVLSLVPCLAAAAAPMGAARTGAIPAAQHVAWRGGPHGEWFPDRWSGGVSFAFAPFSYDYAYEPGYAYDYGYASPGYYDYGYTAPGYYDYGYALPGYYDYGYAAPAPGRDVAYCAQRYRSYDPASGTYLGYDGIRHPCP